MAHPDDELLWFGGALPTYAGERGMAVQVMYMACNSYLRRLELAGKRCPPMPFSTWLRQANLAVSSRAAA